VLYEAALARGLDRWDDDPERLERFERRVAHAASVSSVVPPLAQDARARALAASCAGLRSFAELRAQGGLLSALAGSLPGPALAALERLSPEHVTLPGGRRLRVNYEADRPPWVSSRLQDFFGSQRGPALNERPLVLHLLAPNQRPVQVTTDLANFWQQHYPELRRQLMRRYPRHAWPEDPARAVPPPPAPPRRR
jgi:ATP-dependent helicase HrpB